MAAADRDEGLVRGVGTWGLAASLVNTLVGAGVFVVPAALAASVGPAAPLAFLVCGVAMGAIALCFAEAGSRVPTSGGVYGVVEAAMGPLAGYVAGTLLIASNALGCGAIASALADAAASLVPRGAVGPVRVAIIVVSLGGIAWVNVRGVGHGIRFVRVATAVKMAPLVLFVAVGAPAARWATVTGAGTFSGKGVGRALLLALFALTGMEGPLSASGEVAQPARSIPRALLLSLLPVTLLYIVIQVVAEGVLGPALATSPVPLADAMSRLAPALGTVLLVGAALSMFAWLGSDLLGTPRVLFALARDGLFPRALGRVHPETHVPHVAIATYAAVTAALAVSGTFAELAVLSTLVTILLYVGGAIAAVILARRGVARAGPPLGMRAVVPVAALGVASMLAMVALASLAEILSLFAAVVLSVVLFALRRRSTRR